MASNRQNIHKNREWLNREESNSLKSVKHDFCQFLPSCWPFHVVAAIVFVVAGWILYREIMNCHFYSKEVRQRIQSFGMQ